MHKSAISGHLAVGNFKKSPNHGGDDGFSSMPACLTPRLGRTLIPEVRTNVLFTTEVLLYGTAFLLIYMRHNHLMYFKIG